MDTFLFSFNAILPIICLVLLGYVLRRNNIFTDEFLKVGNKFVFSFCFFSTMFMNIYGIQSFDPVYRDLTVFAALAIISLMAIGLVFVLLFVKDPAQKGVLLQSFYRSNFAIIGIPLAQSLFGDRGGPAAAIVLAVTIPLYNVSSVIFLTVFVKEGNQKIALGKILYRVATNPLIDGICAGFVCLLLRPHLNGWTLKDGNLRFIYKTIENLARITSPMALIILGGQFKFSAAKHLLPQITVGVIARLVLAPVLGLTAAHFLFPGFGGPEFAALTALFGSPVAVASAIMAVQMHNDGELANQLLVWTTLLSSVTIFCIIAFFRAWGIF